MKLLSEKYFADYEVREIPDGTGRKELVYIGNTYNVDIPLEKHTRQKRMFVIMAVISVLLFLTAMLQNVESNRAGAVTAALGIVTVIPLFVTCYGCVISLFKKECMTRSEYIESSMFIKFGSFLTAFLSYVEFVWRVVSGIGRIRSEFFRLEIAVMAIWLCMGMIMSLIWVMEIRTKYVVQNRYGGIIHQEHFKRRNQ